MGLGTGSELILTGLAVPLLQGDEPFAHPVQKKLVGPLAEGVGGYHAVTQTLTIPNQVGIGGGGFWPFGICFPSRM